MGAAPPTLKCSHFQGESPITANHWRNPLNASWTPETFISKRNWYLMLRTFTQDKPSWMEEVSLLKSSFTPHSFFFCITTINAEGKGSVLGKELCFDHFLTQPNRYNTSTEAKLTFVATEVPNRHSMQRNFCLLAPFHTVKLCCPFSHECPRRGSKLCSIIGRLNGAHPPQASYLPLNWVKGVLKPSNCLLFKPDGINSWRAIKQSIHSILQHNMKAPLSKCVHTYTPTFRDQSNGRKRSTNCSSGWTAQDIHSMSSGQTSTAYSAEIMN